MKKLSIVVLFLLFFSVVKAQPFLDEIQAFARQDSLQPPPQHANLFVGSSSFRLWKDMGAAFPGLPVINRGFGGSTLPDVIRYADRIIFPYHARQILIYCGENDLAASDTITAALVAARFRQLFQMIRAQDRHVPVVFISIKPSPSRIHLLPKMKEANEMIRAFLARQKHTRFVDVFTPMLNANGKPREELFRPDRLHMNAEGYAIWQARIRPLLKK